MCSVVHQEAPEKIAREKILFDVVLILLEEHCTGKNLGNVVYKAPNNVAHEKILFSVV